MLDFFRFYFILQAWVSYMMDGGFREAGSGIPQGLVERLQGGVLHEGVDERGARRGQEEEIALRMELEDVAREK